MTLPTTDLIWTLYVPLATLLVFIVWMLRATLRARASLRRVDRETEQIARVLADLKVRTNFAERGERWLGDVYAYITRGSYSGDNPLLELISRVHAMSQLSSPDLYAALSSIKDRELDKLESARETPGSLLLLGIMGTVVGMVVALSTFGAASLQGAETTIDIGRIMSSMFLAFVSTGVALFLSVALRSHLEKVSARQSAMLSDLEGYAFTELAPSLLPKDGVVVQQQLHELLARHQGLLHEALEKSSQALGKVSGSLGQAQQAAQGMNDLMLKNASDVSGSFQQSAKELREVSAEMTSSLLDALRFLSEEVAQQRGGLQAIYGEVQRAVHEERQMSLKQAEAVQQSANATIHLLRENNRELVTGLSTLSARLSQHVAEQTAAVQGLRQDMHALSERLVSAQEDYQQTFLESVKSFIQAQFGELARGLGLSRRQP